MFLTISHSSHDVK